MQQLNRKTATALTMLSVLILIFISSLVGGVGVSHAYATTDKYTYVLYDLQKDSKFNENMYPLNDKDYSLQVIQIAESVDDELFVYVYQPSGKTADLRATSINISKGYKTLKFINYKLTFINSHKTLYKYRVDDFVIEDTRTRHYDITSIYRAWNADYGDSETGNDNTINEVEFAVSKIYTLENKVTGLETFETPTETIQVLSKYVGFVRYMDGCKLFSSSACDSHFVAFSTNIPINELHSADIYYCTQSFLCEYGFFVNGIWGDNSKIGDKEDNYSYVTDKQEIIYEPTGWFNVGTINRDRIQTVEDFIASEDFKTVYSCGLFDVVTTGKINQEGISNLKQCKWVVRFAEFPYEFAENYNTAHPSDILYHKEKCTIVSNVSILRLEGISKGAEFNLGVIDNKQSGSQNPINNWEMTVTGAGKDIMRIIKIILAVLAGIVLIVVVCWVIRVIAVPTKAISKAVKVAKKKNKK